MWAASAIAGSGSGAGPLVMNECVLVLPPAIRMLRKQIGPQLRALFQSQ